jgi:hypothetical protein
LQGRGLFVSGLWFMVCGLWFVVSGYWLLVAGCWLLVAGLLLLVSGYWWLITSHSLIGSPKLFALSPIKFINYELIPGNYSQHCARPSRV